MLRNLSASGLARLEALTQFAGVNRLARLSVDDGEFVIDVSKLMATGWRPQVETRAGIVRMMRAENGAAA